jgi:adenosine deaminase
MTMDYPEYLRRLPKVELHCHVEGTLRPATVVDLARKHDITLPTDDVDRIYDYDTIYEFLEIFRLVNSTVVDRDDFARIAYESLEDGVTSGNLKYREMFFNPTLHTTRGVAMPTIIDGLIDGARAAEADFGVRCFLIADVYRQDSLAMAMQMTEEVIEHRRDEVIGLGMDAAEAPDPPEQFAECFALAGRAGLHRTSHASEDAPPMNITTCLDVLGCERIDHGYHILEDPMVVERCRDEGVHFTCCPTSTAVVYGWPDLTTHPINGMIDAGLLVHLNSDDPTMFRTDIGQEYVDFVGQNDYPPELAKQLVFNGVDATWLDDDARMRLRGGFALEIAELDAAREPAVDAR